MSLNTPLNTPASKPSPATEYNFSGAPAIDLTEEEYAALRHLLYDRFGIHLTDDKRAMVAVRLQKMFRKLGVRTVKEFMQMLSKQDSEPLVELLNHLTTNHTFFYRESEHFDFFHNHVLPEITTDLRQKQRLDLRVWSAGCSSGEEAYMLLMLMMEYFGMQYSAWDAGVLATDISERSLETARNGVYSDERISLLPLGLKKKYFRRLRQAEVHQTSTGSYTGSYTGSSVTSPTTSDTAWEVVPALREQAMFRHFNLMNEHFPFKKPFHAIFCRNVMIYFDRPTREALAERFYHALAPGGYLFVGHSETLGREQTLFEYIMPAVYRKRR
jgi:chemotaxis protein methyltransferase CheR